MRFRTLCVLLAMFCININTANAQYGIDWEKTIFPRVKLLLLCTVGDVNNSASWAAREAACAEAMKNASDPAIKLAVYSLFDGAKGNRVESEKKFREAIRLNKKAVAQMIASIAGMLNEERYQKEFGGYPLTVVARLVDIALQADSSEPFAHQQKGRLLQRQQQHAEAVVAYSTAIGLKPDEGDFYKGRAISLQAMGNQQAAQADIAKAASLEK